MSNTRIKEGKQTATVASTAPDDLEGFLRYNYPTLHRFTKEEQEKVNNHYPAALSFSTTPKQEL